MWETRRLNCQLCTPGSFSRRPWEPGQAAARRHSRRASRARTHSPAPGSVYCFRSRMPPHPAPTRAPQAVAEVLHRTLTSIVIQSALRTSQYWKEKEETHLCLLFLGWKVSSWILFTKQKTGFKNLYHSDRHGGMANYSCAWAPVLILAVLFGIWIPATDSGK